MNSLELEIKKLNLKIVALKESHRAAINKLNEQKELDDDKIAELRVELTILTEELERVTADVGKTEEDTIKD